jgi:hypothetical protein
MAVALESAGLPVPEPDVRLALLICFGLLSLAAAAKASESALCAPEIARVERENRLPPMLLASVSLAESGRKDPKSGERVAWPWTVNAEGQGRYYASKAEAVAEVRKLQKRGVRLIDVGCMQLNLYHHADAFETLEDAFDPATNVDYAASFLLELKEKTRSWVQAVAFYHSQTATLNGPYKAKVMQIWGEEVRRDNDRRRMAWQAAYQERRAKALAEQAERQAAQDAARNAARARYEQQLAQMRGGQPPMTN